jgi:hypothetical protein
MPIKRVAHPKISSNIGGLDRSSRLGTLPRAKLKDRNTKLDFSHSSQTGWVAHRPSAQRDRTSQAPATPPPLFAISATMPQAALPKDPAHSRCHRTSKSPSGGSSCWNLRRTGRPVLKQRGAVLPAFLRHLSHSGHLPSKIFIGSESMILRLGGPKVD